MLALIGTSRFETLIRRLLSTKGSEAAPLLSPEIQPVLVVEDFGPELYALRGDRLFGAVGVVGATASQSGFAQLQNAAGTNTLVIIEQFRVRMGGGSDWSVWLSNTVLAGGTPLSPVSRDGRLPSASVTIVDDGTTLSLPGIAKVDRGHYLSSETDFTERLPIVVSPGFNFIIGNETLNQQMSWSMQWRERSMEQSEESV